MKFCVSKHLRLATVSVFIFLLFCSFVRPSRKIRHRRHTALSETVHNKFIDKTYTFNNYFLKNASNDIVLAEEDDAYFKPYQTIVDSFFNRLLPSHKFNGAIVIAKQGQIIYERYSGWQDRERDIPVNSKTSFHIASVSKTFTAMVILKLDEQKKLNIDAPVQTYLEDFPYEDVSVRDLLNHRSGLNTYDHFMDLYWHNKKEPANNIDVLTNIAVYKKTKLFRADKRFLYSNTNYALLASIIEKITGTRFVDYMKQFVFSPLQMTDTYIYSLADSNTCTPSYDNRGRKERFQYLDLIYGDKNIYTTARDLLRWDLALYNPEFFSREVLRKAYQPYSLERKSADNYGLGWRIKYFPTLDRFVPYHYGWWHGNRSMFIRDIDKKLSVIILSNQLNKNMYQSLELVNLLGKLDEKQ